MEGMVPFPDEGDSEAPGASDIVGERVKAESVADPKSEDDNALDEEMFAELFPPETEGDAAQSTTKHYKKEGILASGAGQIPMPKAEVDDDEAFEDMAAEVDNGEASSDDSESYEGKPSRGAAKDTFHKCVLCLLSSADIDPADFSGEKLVSFDNCLARHGSRGRKVCDNCDSSMRMMMSVRSTSVFLERIRETPQKIQYLISLSWQVAMKHSQQVSRVQKSSIDRQRSLFDVFLDTLNKYFLVHGMNTVSVQPTSPVALRDYIQMFGNPLVNQEQICMGMIGGSLVPCVMTSRQLPRGRYSIRKPVLEVLQKEGRHNELKDHRDIKQLSNVRVDDLEIVPIIGSLAKEYCNRLELAKQVGLPSGATTKFAKQEEESTPSETRTGTGAAGSTDMGSILTSPPTKAKKSRCSEALSQSAGSVLSELPATPAAKRRSEEGSPLAAPIVSTASLARASSRVEGDQLDKDLARIRDKLAKEVKFCAKATWSTGFRGKPKATHNSLVALSGMRTRCCSSKREDMLGDIAELEKVGEAFKSLLEQARAMPNTTVWNSLAVCDTIDKLHCFLEKYQEDYEAGQPKVYLTKQLLMHRAIDSRVHGGGGGGRS